MTDRRTLRALSALAGSYGVLTSYVDASGRRVSTPPEGILGAVRALGAPMERLGQAGSALRERRAQLAGRVVEPVVVAWDGRMRDVSVRVASRASIRVELEDGGGAEVDVAARDGRSVRVAGRERLPFGYHTLRVEAGGSASSATVLSAPRRAPAIPAGSWAVFAPTYALRSGRDRGVGTFNDLRDLDGWAGARGARMTGTLPLFAAFWDEPFEPSPYSPASRLFLNEALVDVSRVREVDPGAPRPSPGAPAGATSARPAPVDQRSIAAATRRALEPLAHRFFEGGRSEAYRRFLAGNRYVRDYARFRAEVDHRRSWWGEWPAAARDGRLRGGAESDPAGRYHLYSQWVAFEQLARAGGRAGGRGLLLDLPLGVNGAGYDVWRHRRAFATGSSVGAPPDPFFEGGQDWGFPPPHPERIREDGYAYPRSVVANLMRYASALRIDHTMGLHRLYWIPSGSDALHGAYVRYREDEWYAMLSIEANRAGSAIVGEDLGTVPGYVRGAMRRHGFLSSYVIRFQAEPVRGLREPQPGSVASLGTHDLPTWAAFWGGGPEGVRSAIAAGLRRRGLLREGRASAADVLRAALRFLAGSDAALVVVSLEDLWLEECPQNVPGTGPEMGNWSGRLRLSLEELVRDERVARLLAAVARERAAAAARSEAA